MLGITKPLIHGTCICHNEYKNPDVVLVVDDAIIKWACSPMIMMSQARTSLSAHGSTTS